MTIEFYYGRKHQAVMEAAGAVDAVKAVVDYCTEHYGSLSFGTGRDPEAHPEPGGRRRLRHQRGQPAGRGGLHRRQPGRTPARAAAPVRS